MQYDDTIISRPMLSLATKRLKRLIKEDAVAIREIRQRARKLAGPDKHKLDLEAFWKGFGARERLLAYAMLRGRRYEDIEPHSRTAPNAGAISWKLRRALKELPAPVVAPMISTTTVNAWLNWPERWYSQGLFLPPEKVAKVETAPIVVAAPKEIPRASLRTRIVSSLKKSAVTAFTGLTIRFWSGTLGGSSTR